MERHRGEELVTLTHRAEGTSTIRDHQQLLGGVGKAQPQQEGTAGEDKTPRYPHLGTGSSFTAAANALPIRMPGRIHSVWVVRKRGQP